MSGSVVLAGQRQRRPGTRGSWTLSGSSLDLDFANNRGHAGGGRQLPAGYLSTTRASTAWAESSAGVWSLFGSNVPRITDKGLLVEETRTTLVPKSRRLDDGAVWTLSSVTTSAVAGVDGVAGSATRLTATSANGTITGPTTSLASAARRLDPFIRRVAGTGNIDLSLDGGATYTTLVGVTSSWQRMGIGQTLANPQIVIRIATSGDEVDIDFAGGETGSSTTSPIESISASATRAADAITLSSGLIGTSGTVYLEYVDPIVAAAPYALHIRASANNEILWRIQFTRKLGVTVSVGTAQASPVTAGAATAGATVKSALTFATNNFALASSLDSAVVTDTSGSVPAAGAVYLGSNAGATLFLNDYIRRLAYWPTPLAASALSGLVAA